MNISRKEFICRGVFSFGRDLVEILKSCSPEYEEKRSVEDHGYLLLDINRCLAQKGGCFACIDRCPQDAISIALGRGITIVRELCDGCGECATVCPIPNVIEMKVSEAGSIRSTKEG